MSKHDLQLKEDIFKKDLKDKSLTYNTITPSPFSRLKPSVDGGQHTKDNSLRLWRLSLKKSYSKFNLQKSYLTQNHKVCLHALRYRIAIT